MSAHQTARQHGREGIPSSKAAHGAVPVGKTEHGAIGTAAIHIVHVFLRKETACHHSGLCPQRQQAVQQRAHIRIGQRAAQQPRMACAVASLRPL